MAMKYYMKLLSGLLIVAIAGGAALAASAADVRTGLSTRETYVGQPVTLRIQVSNATKAEPPNIPDVDGLTIKPLGTPSRSTQITTINGRTTTSTTQTFAYELTPQRDGKFQIPPVTINVDGDSQRTRAIEFVASKSETGDLMFVEIAGKEKQIYVGQSLDVTLKIWLRPYSDRRLKITLSEGDMWRLISDRSEWGPFTERLQQLAERDERPVGKEVLRKDAEGVEHSYYLYQLDATIYPKRPGTIDADNVKVVANYPTALGRSRGLFADFFDDMPGGRPTPFGDEDGLSPFGAQLTVQTVRPLVSQAVVEPINVLPIPTAGRPADYRGAVGQYQIAIDATPTQVKAGDPINLLIGISGTGPMELVQAPPLAELPELATDFKVPTEPLAGFVKGDRKIFSTTIRPRKPGVAQIPPVPFSYFDPAAKEFVTVRSKPVSINVEQSEMLALDAVDDSGQATGASPNPNKSAASSAGSTTLEIFMGDDLLANETPWAINVRLLITLLVLPPLVVLAIVLVQTRSKATLLSGCFGSAASRLQRAVLKAADSAEIARAIKGFVAQQCKLKAVDLSAEKVVGAIRVAGRRNLAIRCEQLINMCANASGDVPFGDKSNVDGLKRQAIQWLEDWQLENQRSRRKPNAHRLKSAGTSVGASSVSSSTSTMVSAIVMIGSLLVAGQSASAQSVELNGLQQRSLLAEANDHYKLALAKVSSDSAEAQQGFVDAADKYQLLVQAGNTNSRLYFNLANAYLASGQTGKAIANYRRCLRIVPTMQEAQKNLAYAQELARTDAEPTVADRQNSSFEEYALVINDWLGSRISPRAVFGIMIVAWIAIWAAVGLRVVGFRLPWKTAIGIAILLFVLTATSTVLTSQASVRHEAVIVAVDDAAATKLSQGQVVEMIQQRGDSVRVRTKNGEAVWLPSNTVETI